MATIKSFLQSLNFLSKKPDNAEIVSRAKRYSGEYSKELPYSRFYDYYHQHPSVKRNINAIHTRWMGSNIEVQSQSVTFDQMWQLWSDTIQFMPKMKEFALDTLITGTGFLEKQYYGKVLANLEHIPTKTLWRIYRNEFARYLSIWQMVDGDVKQLAPDHLVIMTINNPERDAVGKSEMYAVAVPQKVSGKVDEFGNPINPDRYLPSILDVKARLNYAHMEFLEKTAKSRVIVSLKNEKDTKRQKQIEDSFENEADSKFITVTNSDIDVKPIQIDANPKMERWMDDIDTQINQASGYPGKVIDEASSMGYASSQTPIQELSQKIQDMQNDLSSIIQLEIFKPLCEQWKLDYDVVQPKLVFNTFVEKITFEQLIKIPPTVPLAPEELREVYRQFMPGMDDKLWEEHAKKMESQRKEEMQMQGGKGKDDTDKKNPRPDIEKGSPKPDSSMEYLLRNPSEFKKFVEKLVAEKAKEMYSYFPMPPSNQEPYEAPQAEITNPETLERVKAMLADVKAGNVPLSDAEDEVDRISSEVDKVGYWISELKKAHPEWKHDQVVAVAMKKSKEGIPTPHDYMAVPGAGESKCRVCGLPLNDLIHKRESADEDGTVNREIPKDQYPEIKSDESIKDGEDHATIKRGKVKLKIGSPQDKLLHARGLPHSHVHYKGGKKSIKRY